MQNLTLTVDNARCMADLFIERIPKYPGHYRERGVVIAAGGSTYFTNAWVCIHMLRQAGCNLPVQLWYLGPKELDDRMKALVLPLGVECIDAREIRKQHPCRILNGWELKPYSIIHCDFREVISLDADNVVVTNPEYLFATEEFKRTGAIFWPDYNRLAPDRDIWSLCGVRYRDEPEFESGQILIDKQRCWRPLCLAMWYNEYSDFFYQFVHGDKETFHMAFRRLGQEYSMTNWPIHPLIGTMCQHDFDGIRLFQHRNMAKWQLHRENARIEGFWLEDDCLKHVEKLRQQWDGRIVHLDSSDAPPGSEEWKARNQLLSHAFEYRRVGHDSREMTFLPGGIVGRGSAACEVYWRLINRSNVLVLEISGDNELTCRLRRTTEGEWTGRWLRHEQMPIQLVEKSRSAANPDPNSRVE